MNTPHLITSLTRGARERPATRVGSRERIRMTLKPGYTLTSPNFAPTGPSFQWMWAPPTQPPGTPRTRTSASGGRERQGLLPGYRFEPACPRLCPRPWPRRRCARCYSRTPRIALFHRVFHRTVHLSRHPRIQQLAPISSQSKTVSSHV